MEDMKKLGFYAAFNKQTGYGNHACSLAAELEKLLPVLRNEPGDVNLSLLDVVTASQTTTFPPRPSILMTVWESTAYPDQFIANLKHYDQLWVVSEWERSCGIAQGIPEEFIKVIHEGIDPDIFKPISVIDEDEGPFTFLHVGQWQPRKSTKEICECFIKAFPKEIGCMRSVRLYLSADTLFPSDPYKSTEERLQAYGLTDSRIIPIHYEDRDEYVRRLQSAHCFVSCSRAEGWGLPFLESMATGVPAILADYSGSTEYGGDALLVRVPKLEKPHGIYGNWDVPGMWGSPDYDHLVEVMQDAYANYPTHKAKALETSKMTREKFSWAAAAKTAYDIIQAIPAATYSADLVTTPTLSPEDQIRAYARTFGYEIPTLTPRRSIFIIDSHPDTPEKLACLVETIEQVKPFGYPILIATHYPIPDTVISTVDYYIYDKNDPMSPLTDMPIYFRQLPDGTEEHTQSSIPCHAFASNINHNNAMDFCRGKFDWVYKMASDAEVDISDWLKLAHASSKPMQLIKYEGRDDYGIQGILISSSFDCLDKLLPRHATWEEYAAYYGDDRFCCERGAYKTLVREIGLDKVDWIDVPVDNRFDQVDHEAWADDQFQCHFIEGPFLNIVGISNREYDVAYSTPTRGDVYNVKMKPGMWSRPDKKYYQDWTIIASLDGVEKFRHHLDLAGKNVILSLGSKALGDTMAWMPYISEFQIKHNCIVYCSTWWNNIMDYPNLNFILPGDTIEGIYATYDVGCFDDQLDRNVTNWRLTPLQKVAADILGLDFEPLPAKLSFTPYVPKSNGNPPKPYICFSEFSTMQNKFWNHEGGWQKVIDYCNSLGYDCVSISAEPSTLTGIINHNGQSIEQTLTDLSGAAFYIGLNHGPIWLAYALGLKTIMIDGVAEEWNNFPNPYRIYADTGCKPCFNDITIPIDRGFDWCHNENRYLCTKSINESMVIETIDRLREDIGRASKNQKAKRKIPGKHPQHGSRKRNNNGKGSFANAVA